jgi:prepilin-type processing-associated H-X9-DG protein
MYADDNRDFLPRYGDFPSGGMNIWCAPNGPLVTGKYISKVIIYGGDSTAGYGACPSASLMWEYAMNWYVGKAYLKRGMIKSPSGTFIVLESAQAYYFAPGADSINMWRHSMQMNILYCDGHVSPRKRFSLAYSAPFYKSC